MLGRRKLPKPWRIVIAALTFVTCGAVYVDYFVIWAILDFYHPDNPKPAPWLALAVSCATLYFLAVAATGRWQVLRTKVSSSRNDKQV